jgi:hypothetical protein
MKPSKRERSTRKSKKVTKQKGSGSELFEGPLDTTVHAYMRPEDMSEHINWMNRKKENYDNIIQSEVDRINTEITDLNALKEYDQQVETDIKEKNFQAKQLQKQLSSSESLAAAQQYNTFLTFLGVMIKFIYEAIVKFIEWLGYILDCLLINFAKMGQWSSYFPAWIMRIIDGFFNGNFINSPWKRFWIFLFGVLFVIIVLILILIFFMMIFYEISYLITGSMPASANNIITSCRNITELSLLNFSSSHIGTLYNDTVRNITSYRPKFPEIPTYDFSLSNVFYNPFSSLANFTNLQLNQFLNSALIATLANKLRYGYNITADGVQFISGIPKASELSERIEFTNGRRDNITLVDSDVFEPDSLSSKLNLQDTALVMAKPNDIIWKMPEYEYNFKDIRKLPPSLLKKKDKSGISLLDKKEIVIPWVMKDNFYSLSCNDAYFNNSSKEKANILIDSDDSTTCTFDIGSKVTSHTEPAKRYTYVNDLSNFL